MRVGWLIVALCGWGDDAVEPPMNAPVEPNFDNYRSRTTRDR